MSEQTLEAVPIAGGPEQDGRYLHWDELRHRPPPQGLDHRTWWRAVRLSRAQLSRPLPLVDEFQRPFTFAMTDTIQRAVHEIDREATGHFELPEDVRTSASRDRYVVHSLIEEAITSSQLEGAATTRRVAKEMIRSNRAPRTIDERMILNNFRAMEWLRERRSHSITPDHVLELHSILTDETLDKPDAAGRFRRDDEVIQVVDDSDGTILHVPPKAHLLAGRVKTMCEFANGAIPKDAFIHPVIRAVLVHFWLAYDHPFVDGNGRTARALFYWTMLREGYWVSEFISISSAIKKARTQYDRAYLFVETDGNDTTYFIQYHLKILRVAIDDLVAYLDRALGDLRAIEARLRDRDDLNHRQLALLGHALRNPDARYSIEGHQTSHRVAYQTARTDLLSLAARGYLEQIKGPGKRFLFRPSPSLEKRLRAAPS